MTSIEKLHERPCPAGCRARHPEFGMVEVLEVRGDKRLVLFAAPDGDAGEYEAREVPFNALRACDPARDLQVPRPAPPRAAATVLAFPFPPRQA